MIPPLCGCGAGGWDSLGVHDELSRISPEMVEVSYHVCCECGAIAKWPFPEKQELRHYYEKSWQYASERPALSRAAEFIARGTRTYDGGGKFPLQAGPGMGQCSFVGNGSLLEVAAKGDGMLRACESAGIRLLGSSGLDAQPKHEGIEPAWLGEGNVARAENALVIAAHVLEHVADPFAFLIDLLRLTADDGYVYIEVPSLQAGQFDIGLCDDINRNHLWHFGLTGLMRLGSRLATVVLIETDTSLPGWPVDRMLLRKRTTMDSMREWFSLVARDVECEYRKAELALLGRDPKATALYGASHSYAQLRRLWYEPRRFPVYDLYKAGEGWDGVTVRHPSALAADGIREVFVTTRSYNSYLDIQRALYESHPWLPVYTLYPNIRAACGEDEPPRPSAPPR